MRDDFILVQFRAGVSNSQGAKYACTSIKKKKKSTFWHRGPKSKTNLRLRAKQVIHLINTLKLNF